ncbi:hypothetical protein ACFL6B_03825, partial [Thermodesulfobacteriota bacterium]
TKIMNLDNGEWEIVIEGWDDWKEYALDKIIAGTFPKMGYLVWEMHDEDLDTKYVIGQKDDGETVYLIREGKLFWGKSRTNQGEWTYEIINQDTGIKEIEIEGGYKDYIVTKYRDGEFPQNGYLVNGEANGKHSISTLVIDVKEYNGKLYTVNIKPMVTKP